MSTTARRLTASLLAILSVFAASVLLTYLMLARIADAENQVNQLERVFHGTQAVVAEFREQALLQAHALISFERAHVGAYEQSAKQTREQAKELVALTDGADRTLALEIDAITARIDQTFGTEFLSVMASGDRERARALAARSERLVDDVVQISERLDRSVALRRAAAIERATRVRDRTIWLVTSCLLIALLLAAVVGILMTRSIVRPVAALSVGAQQIASGNLSARVAVRGGGELALLATTFNQMAESLKHNQDELVRTHKLAAVGQLAAAVAHEINNPLSVILGYAKMLRRTPERVDAEKLRAIEEEGLQCQRIVKDLLDLVRPSVLEVSDVDLGELVRNELARISDVLDAREVRGPDPQRRVVVSADAGKLRQVISNLVRNAADATPPGGRISVEVSDDETRATVDICDNGSGISVDAMPRVFEPFFTTKRHGTGLGLPIAQSIVEAHGGKLEIASTPGQSTRVRITLPTRARVREALT